jgi:hypothetical protein
VKIVDVKQGSAEWVQARIGLPTASCFDQIVTPAKGERSKSMNKYLARLFAEWYLNAPMDDANSGFMERGTALESQAAGWYGLMHDVEVHKVGLCLRDDGKAGASPDGLVGENGLVEIKCLGAQAHAEALIAGGSQNDYRMQVQGQLYITVRDWCDRLYFHPSMPQVEVRFERDEAFIRLIDEGVNELIARLDELRARWGGERDKYRARLDEAADHVF